MKPRYRRLLDAEEALRLLLSRLGPPGSMEGENIPSEEAVGRVSAEPVRARHSSPPYHAAAMDGIAVLAATTSSASTTTPLALANNSEAVPIDTGNPMPAGTDAVIPVEQVQTLPDDSFLIMGAASPRQHVRLSGEDAVAGEILLPRSRRLTAAQVGAMLGTGVTRIVVRRQPRVAILPTGNELCEPGEDPRDGKVVESNSRMLAAMVLGWGGRPQRLPPVPDDTVKLRTALRKAVGQADLVLVLAGSSAGRRDFTPAIIAEEGEVLFHGLGLMPGRPTTAGVVDGKIVIGVPGFPVSAIVAADRLLRPVLAHMLGVLPEEPEALTARLLRDIPSRPGLEEAVRVVVGRVAGQWVASPLGRGAGAITTLTRAHGIIRIGKNSEGLPAGSEVQVALLCARNELERSLLFAGSHDLALSLLDDRLSVLFPGSSLNVAPLGSLGGLNALARGEAHLAGCHLLDPATGTYNLPAISRVLPGRELLLVTLAYRAQGLCLRPDTAHTPRSLGEVVAAGLRWVNRQPGSGTRVLTDHLLAQAGIPVARLPGYDHEEFTHMAVAEAIRTRAADCGMAVRAAADAAGLMFVQLAEERYDLIIPREFLSDIRIQHLLGALAQPAFKTEVEQLGGYDTRETGRIQALPPGSWNP